MKQNRQWMRTAAAGGVVAALSLGGTAQALEFDLAGTAVKIENLATVGALMRMQERDSALVGKSTQARLMGLPGPCVQRTGDDGVSGPNTDGNNTFTGDTCSGTRTRPATNAPNPPNANAVNSNTVFLQQPGGLTPNGDDGNTNFDKYDIAYATAKLTSDISFQIADFNFFTRTVGYFDGIYSSMYERNPDTTLRPLRTPYDSRDRSGVRFQALDYFVSRRFELGDRNFNLKIGNQVLNWGESAFLLANSLNSINPPDQSRLRIPGFDVKELARPVGMVLLEGDVVEGVSAQAFYQYDWKPVIVDPVGSYFSVSDTLGEGGKIAMLSFAKAPEDPLQLYEPALNPNDPIYVLNSHSSRTLLRDYALEKQYAPKQGGQFGFSTKIFLDSLNNGTELGLYFANYHARIPSVSAISTNATCIPAGTNSLTNPAQLAAFAASCGLDLTQVVPGAKLPLENEALPLDTGKVFVEYPENIKMYGFSFNTTVGDFALSGEYAYRPNLPIQVHTTDLVFALLQPGFPDQDIAIAPGLTLPGRRTAVPDFITQYRNPGCTPNCVAPNQYIRGYEQMKIGQGEVILLKTIGGDNPLGASQITLLLEGGFTHLPDYPKLSEFQSNGAGTDTHISAGIGGNATGDGNVGVNPVDIRADANNPRSHKCDVATPSANQTQAQATAACYTLLQNPISQDFVDPKGFGTPESYGYRFVTLTRYDSAFFGANVEFLNAFFHDVHGVGPGLGQNFVEGRKQILSGIRLDYLSRFIGEVRYTWFTGGANRDALRDRDNIFVFLGYQF